MADYRQGSHTVYDIKYHFVWITKYRYQVLLGEIAKRVRALLVQGCQSYKIGILGGHVGKDHIHMILSCSPSMSPSYIMQCLKGKTSHDLQSEFPE